MIAGFDRKRRQYQTLHTYGLKESGAKQTGLCKYRY